MLARETLVTKAHIEPKFEQIMNRLKDLLDRCPSFEAESSAVRRLGSLLLACSYIGNVRAWNLEKNLQILLVVT